MLINPAGMLYRKMEASLSDEAVEDEKVGFFSRGGLQKPNIDQPATRAQHYFSKIRSIREGLNNGRTKL
tara:strand:+ start:201 stop:407 length:207 start_codon:yes stop_codon:yes gene_type:complete